MAPIYILWKPKNWSAVCFVFYFLYFLFEVSTFKNKKNWINRCRNGLFSNRMNIGAWDYRWHTYPTKFLKICANFCFINIQNYCLEKPGKLREFCSVLWVDTHLHAFPQQVGLILLQEVFQAFLKGSSKYVHIQVRVPVRKSNRVVSVVRPKIIRPNGEKGSDTALLFFWIKRKHS